MYASSLLNSVGFIAVSRVPLSTRSGAFSEIVMVFCTIDANIHMVNKNSHDLNAILQCVT